MKNIKYLIIGAVFGIILTKGEVISWFRIQEMFRFQSFHMYGIIGSAVVIGFISVQIIKRKKARAANGELITFKDKDLHTGVIIGGTLFGFGWALTGACPGPLYTMVGNGYSTFIITLLSAVLGTFAYGALRPHLPHKKLFGTGKSNLSVSSGNNPKQKDEFRKAS